MSRIRGSDAPSGAKSRLLRRAHIAFLEHGYQAPTMALLAELCGVTRRTLYYHYTSKEALFRDLLRTNNTAQLAAGDAAAAAALARGDGPVEVISLWLDVRFGKTRRDLAASPHGRELNDVAFRLATDLMIEVSHESNTRIATLVEAFRRQGRLSLRDGVDVARAARLIGDGARGVNQARPPVPANLMARHYREITEAILFGCAVEGS